MTAANIPVTKYNRLFKGYLTKLLVNDAVKSYILRHEPEILEQFELVANTVSMEEALHQQEIDLENESVNDM